MTDPVDHYSRTLTTVLDLSAAGFLALFFEYLDLFVVTRLAKHCLISDPPFFPHQAPGGWSFRPHKDLAVQINLYFLPLAYGDLSHD